MAGQAGRPRILVMGDLVLDLVAVLGGELQYGTDTRGEIYPRPGGSAANTATWLARLGRPVAFIGRVGADPLGSVLIEGLRQEGIEPFIARDAQAPTGTIISVIDPTGERSMIISPGSNHRLTPADVPVDAFAGAGLIHLTGYSFFWDAPRRAARAMLAAAAARGIPVSFDASSASLLRDFGPDRLLAEVARARYFLCNLDEGRLLTGRTEPEEVLGALAGKFPVVGLKLGPGGALCAAGQTVVRVAAAPAPAVDSTGCGDAWDAGFLAALQSGHDLARAAEVAVRTAAWVVARPGAVPLGWTQADRDTVWGERDV